MPEELKPAVELAVTGLAIMAFILLAKLGASYLPSNGAAGALKGWVQAV